MKKIILLSAIAGFIGCFSQSLTAMLPESFDDNDDSSYGELYAGDDDFDIKDWLDNYQGDDEDKDTAWKTKILPKVLELFSTGDQDQARDFLDGCYGMSSFLPKDILAFAQSLDFTGNNKNEFLAFVKKVLDISDEPATINPEKDLQEGLDRYKLGVAYAANPEVKLLQEDLVMHDTRTITQLISLDQYESDMKSQYGLKCGFFVVYNLMQVKKCIDQQTGFTLPLGTKDEFKAWMQAQEEYLIEAIKKDSSLGAYEKIDPSSSSGIDENVELAASHILVLMARDDNFTPKTQEMLALIEYDLSELGSRDQHGSKTTLESVLSGAVQYPAGEDIYHKIREYRTHGTPLFMVYLYRGHWRIFVMTKQGMYTANSYGNASHVGDPRLKQLYDFFLISPLPEVTKESVVQPSPLQAALTKLRDALAQLKERLTRLKDTLSKLLGN